MDVIIGAAVADGKVTPKVQSLIKILLKYQQTEDFRAIIFVERVVAALVLPKVCIYIAVPYSAYFFAHDFYSQFLEVAHTAMFCSLLQVFAELPSLSFINCASLIGHNNSQEMRTCQMQDTIAKFRDGRVCLI